MGGGVELRRNYYLSSGEFDSGCVFSEEAVRKMLYADRTFFHTVCGKIYRLEIFNGISFPEGLYYEDVPTTYRIYIKARHIAFTEEHLYGWRITPGSITHQKYSPKMLSCITATRMLFLGVTEKYPMLSQAAASMAFNANRNVYLYFPFSKKIERMQVWAEMKKYRSAIIFDNQARKRERIAALLSYLGADLFHLCFSWLYRKRQMRR